MKSAGSWAFAAGFILAIVFGVIAAETGSMQDWVVWILVVLGLIVGFLNITDKEVRPFLHAGAILVIVTSLAGQSQIVGDKTINEIIPLFGGILNALLILFVPATIIVAIKSVYMMASK